MDAATVANLVLAVVAIVISMGAAIDARRQANGAAAIELRARVGQVFAPTLLLAQTLQQGGLAARAEKRSRPGTTTALTNWCASGCARS